jgi:hypothetical protein
MGILVKRRSGGGFPAPPQAPDPRPMAQEHAAAAADAQSCDVRAGRSAPPGDALSVIARPPQNGSIRRRFA